MKKELSEIRAQQASSKGNSTKIREEKTTLEADLKTKLAEFRKKKDALHYKSLNELNGAIDKLERQVESGQMRLVDERKALDTISRLKKQRRSFDDLEAGQKKIDEIRAAIDEKKKLLDDPEVKRLGARFAEINTELDQIRAKQDEAYAKLNEMRDEKTRLQAIQQEKFLALRKLGDDFSREKKAFKKWEDENFKAKREKQRLQKEAEERERRRKVAEEKLEEASAPAFEEDINLCETLIAYFDPTAPEAQAHKTKAPLLSSDAKLRLEESKIRTVDDSGLKGVKLSKKEDREEEYFMGGSGGKKKGKKGGNKASAAATPEAPVKFNVSAAVFEQCGRAGVKVPDSQAAVPETLAQLRELLAKYKRDQKQQTEAVSKSQLHHSYSRRYTFANISSPSS